MSKQKISEIVFVVGAILVLAGGIMYKMLPNVAPYVFSVGVVGLLYARITNIYKGDDFRKQRFQRLLFLVSLIYIATAVLMFYQSMYWVMAFAIAAGIEIIVAIRMPK